MGLYDGVIPNPPNFSASPFLSVSLSWMHHSLWATHTPSIPQQHHWPQSCCNAHLCSLVSWVGRSIDMCQSTPPSLALEKVLDQRFTLSQTLGTERRGQTGGIPGGWIWVLLRPASPIGAAATLLLLRGINSPCPRLRHSWSVHSSTGQDLAVSL